MAINNYRHNLKEPLVLNDVNISGNIRVSGIFNGSVSAPNGFIGNVTGNITNTVTGTGTTEIVRGNMADNDQFRILIGGTASDAGYAEIATADGGNEPIYVRQYTGIFTTLTRTLTLLDGSGNTSIPGTLTVTSNLTVSGGTITAGNVAASLLTGNTTTGISFATAQTTGTLTVGGASQTGTTTIDQSIVSHTLNIASGISGIATSKTVNIATGGGSGSRTLITIGSATAGSISTVTIPSPANLLIGTASTTGTASQPLQVTGGAYVSGNFGVGNTNPTSALTVTGNTLITGVTTITGNLNALGNYYVKVARLTNQTITNGADALIEFSVVSDPNNWYSGIATRTTPTVAGTYHVDVMLNWQAGSVVNNQTNIQIRKNGNTFALSQVGIETNFAYTQTACGIVTMNGISDYIDFTVFTGNPTSQVVTGTADGVWTKMEIFKIN